MKSAALGTHTSPVEVTNVSPHGFWLFIERREVFVSFETFPWFREASIREIGNVTLPSPHHLHWPDLDVDLAVDSLDHPERFPLVSRAQPQRRTSSKKQQSRSAPSTRRKHTRRDAKR
jgi:Protein of unknown function (DUF2442)